MSRKVLIWHGLRTPWKDENTVVMRFEDELLYANVPLYLDEVNHSPTGFEWGYLGSGPAQLAYAILRTYYERVENFKPEGAKYTAAKLYQRFKEDIVCRRFGRNDEWVLTSDDIYAWLVSPREKSMK